jgi:uncharacterized protein YndB with AHSA1/START domain
MVTVNVRAEVDVAAPAEVVWAALTDWSRQGEWMVGTRTWVISGDGRSVGSRLLGFTGVFDLGFADLLEITEWTPPTRCVVRHTGRLLAGSAEFVITPTVTGVRLAWVERLRLPIGPLLVLGMRYSLRRLARRTEKSVASISE